MGIALLLPHLNQIYHDLQGREISRYIEPAEALRELVQEHGYKELIKRKIAIKKSERDADEADSD